jgi:MarR family transcriptional regulator, organic hydroperoxide resistance regulator
MQNILKRNFFYINFAGYCTGTGREGSRVDEKSKGIRAVKVLKHVMDAIKQNIEYQFREMHGNSPEGMRIHITGPQGMLMGILAKQGEMKISDLSNELGLSNSTVSGIVDRLERNGFVERKRSDKDRRIVYVCVTSKFQNEARKHFNKLEKWFEVIMNKAAPEELDTVVEGLDTLKKILEKHSVSDERIKDENKDDENKDINI